MKKIIIALTAIITMMLYIASPLFIKPLKANAANVSYNNINSPADNILQDYLGTATQPYWHPSTDNSVSLDSDCKLLYLAAKQTRNGEPCDTLGLLLAFNNADYTFENGVITLDNVIITNENSGYYKIVTYYWGRSTIDYWGSYTFKSAEIDLVNKSVILYAENGFTGAHQSEWYIQGNNTVIDEFWDIESNIDSLNLPTLNLSVSFSPTMSGTVSRSGTLSGHSIEYKYLEMQVNNNGDNAQFAMFIVPSGQNIYFPTDLLNTPQGFIGNPTFAYITDEWIDWTNGATNISGWLNTGSTGIGIDMQMLYSPCAWHTLTQGSQRTYRINWDMMKLNKDISYDIVVYGMINPTPVNASSTGTGLGCWTVMSSLSDVQEVYRSTFNIIDPVVFNADSIDEVNAAHPWNPDIDNTNMFNKGNVYKDANGNYVIKGSSGSGSGSGGSFYDGFPNYASLNNMFGGFFGFLNSALNAFPSIFLTIITLGLTGIIIVGIVKVAFK